MKSFLTGAMALALCSGAQAMGGAACNSTGGQARVELRASVTHGMGAPVFDVTATAEIDDKSLPEALRSGAFGKPEMAQYWSDGEDLRFGFYRRVDGDKRGAVDLIIRAKNRDDETYDGTYELIVYDAARPALEATITYKGAVECMVE